MKPIVLDDSLLNSDWTKVGAFDFPMVETVEDFERELMIPADEPARTERLEQLAELVWVDAAPAPIREMLLAVKKSVAVQKMQVKVDAMIEVALAKASFGGDRSAAGRYAAEQRWKGHTPNQSPRDFKEVLTNLKTVEQKFKERVREQARGMSDEELQREYDSLDWVAESNLDDAMYGKYRREALGEEITERRTERVRQGIVETVKREGGMSVKIESGDQPVDGFMVARKENSVIVSADDFFDETEGKRIMSDFLKENRARFGKDQFLGIWHNKKNGKVYLDITDNIKDRSEAERLGKERNQISIWDVVNGAEIDTGGTGEG